MSEQREDAIVRAAFLAAILFGLLGCALFEPGPRGEPSPHDAGMAAVIDRIEERPPAGIGWVELGGTLGGVLAAYAAAAFRQKKKNDTLRQRLEKLEDGK